MDKKTIVTIVICIAALMLWHNVVAPKMWPPQEQPAQPTQPPDPRLADTADREEPADAARAVRPGTGETTDQPPGDQPDISDEQPDVQDTTLSNEYLTLELTNVGGTIREAYLNQFKESATDKSSLRLLAPMEPGQHSLALRFEPEQGLAGRRFHVVEADEQAVVYQTTLQSGLRITKTIELPDDAYHAVMTVRLENVSGKEMKVAYRATSAAGIMPEMPSWKKNGGVKPSALKTRYIQGAVAAQLANGLKVFKKGPGKVQESPWVYDAATVEWVGLKNRYFSAVLKPMTSGLVVRGQISSVGENNVTASLESVDVVLKPNAAAEHPFMFFIGPNSKKVLANPAYTAFAGLHKVPWPAPVTKLFLGILHTFYGIVGNYGVAIIMLTLLVRAALHPLTRKSQKSMHEMQSLGPKMKELKEKHKDDKKRQQEETMKLYREHGVNPMGGCLPIFLQLPILIGLFGALRYAIELRQAPFFLWMKDLSQPDALMMLPDDIPLLGGGPLNILPILMIVAMFLQQKLTPKPAADAQAEQTQKMMMWMMPAMFGFLFYSMPSGLVLYFMTSTGLGALESHLIRRHMDKLGKLPAKKSKKKKKKENWVERATRTKAGRGRKLK